MDGTVVQANGRYRPSWEDLVRCRWWVSSVWTSCWDELGFSIALPQWVWICIPYCVMGTTSWIIRDRCSNWLIRPYRLSRCGCSCSLHLCWWLCLLRRPVQQASDAFSYFLMEFMQMAQNHPLSLLWHCSTAVQQPAPFLFRWPNFNRNASSC